MSEPIVSTNSNCCGTICPDPVTVNVPGPSGAAGAAGASGMDGVNAYATLTVAFTMPAFSATGFATVDNPLFLVIGEPVFLESLGTFRVMGVAGPLVTLLNLCDNAGAYPLNAAPGTVAPITSKLTPTGWMGQTGSTPATALLKAQNLFDLTNAGTARTNLGLGALAVLSTINNALWSGAALTVANGGTGSTTAAAARTALGLGSMAVQLASAVSITGGTILGTTIGGAAGSFTTLSVTGAAAFSAGVSFGGPVYDPSSVIQSLLVATTVNPNAKTIRVVGNGGPVLLASTPTITAPLTDGQVLRIRGTDNTNTVTFQSESSLAGSKLKLGAGTRVLGKNDQLILCFDLATGFWIEDSFANNEA